MVFVATVERHILKSDTATTKRKQNAGTSRPEFGPYVYKLATKTPFGGFPQPSDSAFTWHVPTRLLESEGNPWGKRCGKWTLQHVDLQYWRRPRAHPYNTASNLLRCWRHVSEFQRRGSFGTVWPRNMIFVLLLFDKFLHQNLPRYSRADVLFIVHLSSNLLIVILD